MGSVVFVSKQALASVFEGVPSRDRVQLFGGKRRTGSNILSAVEVGCGNISRHSAEVDVIPGERVDGIVRIIEPQECGLPEDVGDIPGIDVMCCVGIIEAD